MRFLQDGSYKTGNYKKCSLVDTDNELSDQVYVYEDAYKRLNNKIPVTTATESTLCNTLREKIKVNIKNYKNTEIK